MGMTIHASCFEDVLNEVRSAMGVPWILKMLEIKCSTCVHCKKNDGTLNLECWRFQTCCTVTQAKGGCLKYDKMKDGQELFSGR